jgi:ABC-type lipoprotein release transport system permease subunit
LVLGVDPGQEARVSTLAQTIDQGNYFPEVTHIAHSGFATAVVGRLLADNLRVHVGDEITIMGQGRDGSVAATVARVIGTFASGLDDFDRNTIVIPLSEFQAIYSMGDAAHEIVAICRSLKQVTQLKCEISQYLSKSFPDTQLAVLDWETLVPGLRQAISMDLVMGVIMYFILVIVVAFSILNTFLMAIFERTREFGVLMALGTKPSRLTRVLIAESAMLTLIGISAGILVGVFITIYFQVNGIDVSGSSELLKQYGITGRIHPRLSMFTALTGPLAVFMITLLSAMYPAFKIRKMKPLDALAHT